MGVYSLQVRDMVTIQVHTFSDFIACFGIEFAVVGT